MNNQLSSSEELKIIEEKRSALEKAVKVALTIEQLQNGLEAVVELGKSTAAFSASTVERIDALDAATKGMPTAKLKSSLAALENVVRARLAQILQIAELDDEALVSADPEQVELYLKDYRKRAHTAVAIRILLHKRGIDTGPTELTVPPDMLMRQLARINVREKACRLAVRSELVSMIDETERMLASSTLTGQMRQVLEVSQGEFQQNLTHLDAGKSIVSMPVAIEIVEVTDGSVASMDTSAESEGGGAPSIQHQTIFAPLDPLEPAPKAPVAAVQPAPKSGFLKQVWRWASTPVEVSWGEVKKEGVKKGAKKASAKKGTKKK